MSDITGQKELYRRYLPPDTLAFMDSKMVRRIEAAFRQHGELDLQKFVSLIYDLAVANSDLRSGEEQK